MDYHNLFSLEIWNQREAEKESDSTVGEYIYHKITFVCDGRFTNETTEFMYTLKD